MRFVQIATGIDVLPVMLELHRAEHLWDRDPERRLYPNTPHAEMVDIVVRYMPEADVTMEARRAEHRNVFWPAWHTLPSLRPVVLDLMRRVSATELGSILITRLPPGGKILPHSDRGSWAPEYYNCKCHLTLAGTALVRCEDEEARFEAGTIFTFDNLLMHSIFNAGKADRIVVIISLRCDT
jgi:mannose-6-phosphate isomerase-like protein (cupin superfamily)